jgi:hypothetical protein
MDVTLIFSTALALCISGLMIYFAIGIHTTMPKVED